MATDWDKIRLEFVNGVSSFKELSEKHDAGYAALRKRATREDWLGMRHNLSQNVTKKAQGDLGERRVFELAKLNEADLIIVGALREKAKSMMVEVDNAQALRALASVFETAQRMGRLALGAETESSIVRTQELPASVDEFV
jgi:hypothetical protein